uniref:Uncharacterized protein n=1 Tax=Mycena chlorophos TaxID=658473 RepID=A0ABQ0LU11_MYCCL|nr:predicted protein [Mycena chlorophos]
MPSTRPISPPTASASSSGSGSSAGTPAAGPSSSASHPTLRPTIGRNTSENSAALSWIEPEDFNPDTLFDPPAPIRPFSGYERTRTTSADTRTTLFDAAHSRSPSVAMSLSALAAASGGEGNRASTSLSLNYVPSNTLAASMSLLTCTIGWAGVMLNNRSFLAVYNLFLWFSFAFTVVPGYITFKEHSLNLQGKLNFQWSERLDIDMRRAIQDTLHCCGYASPFVEASISSTCYARSLLPGCQAPFFAFEKSSLEWWYAAVFSVAGYNIGMIVVALLCSNHVTYRFGKGMMPERYRLDEAAVRIIMAEYAQQLEETYGPEVALAALQRASAYALDHNMSDPLTTSASYPGLLMHSRNASTVELGAVPMRPMSYHDPFVRSASALGTPGSEREVGQEVRYGALAGSE